MSFEHSDLEKVKLSQEYDDRTKKQKYCPVYQAKHGIEELLFVKVKERFRKIAAQLEWAIRIFASVRSYPRQIDLRSVQMDWFACILCKLINMRSMQIDPFEPRIGLFAFYAN